MPKLKVLCLHGFNSNALVFRRRISLITEACKDVADFHFLNAPHLVPLIRGLRGLDEYPTEQELGIPDDPPQPCSDEQYQAHKSAQAIAQTQFPLEKQARGWWRQLHSTDRTFWGWTETLTWLSTELQTIGSVDVILGFSQGAALSLLLTAAFEQSQLITQTNQSFRMVPHIPELVFHENQKPLKLLISIAGFRTIDPRQAQFFVDQTFTTPVLSINGQLDPLVQSSKSMGASKGFSNWKDVYHTKGHIIPIRRPWLTFFHDTLASFASDTPHWIEIPLGIQTSLDENENTKCHL